MSDVQVGINWPVVAVWLFVLQWVFNAGIAAWVYFRNADTSNTKEIHTVATDLGNFITASRNANETQNVRLSKLETTMKHMPNDEEISRLREAVADTKARVEGMAEGMRRVERQTNLIHDHLLRTRA